MQAHKAAELRPRELLLGEVPGAQELAIALVRETEVIRTLPIENARTQSRLQGRLIDADPRRF
jgi:hypothetical protein